MVIFTICHSFWCEKKKKLSGEKMTVNVILATVKKVEPKKKQPLTSNGIVVQLRSQEFEKQVESKVYPMIEFIALNEEGEKFPFKLPISIYMGYEDESSFADRLKFKNNIFQKAKNILGREDIVEVV